MSVSRRYTIADLDAIEVVEGYRYEVIDGELHVSRSPSWHHQFTCTRLIRTLDEWSEGDGTGLVIDAPGVIFNVEDAVQPDVIWISHRRMRGGTDRAGHFVVAPELVVEVLSPGSKNERRDREIKLALYAREAVEEYWLVDWQHREVLVYRRGARGMRLVETLTGDATLATPLLPGFSLTITRLWPPSWLPDVGAEPADDVLADGE